jgi:UDP-glucose:(glucosyl)LPS alpha-1,2-glucosyltransferase
MPIAWNEISEKSNGGTERMARLLERDLPADLLEKFQIIPSRVRDLDNDKVRVLWCHDLPGDPESEHLKNGGFNNFHRIVFVSYYQRDWYMRHYKIPASKCVVMHNAIVPLEPAEKADDGKIRLIYHTTPHRGLELLVPVVTKLAETHPEIHLDIFSSFNAYGWPERDTKYEPVFELARKNENMTYHGYAEHDVVMEYLKRADIFAYPSIWQETSCIALMEAMSAGVYCVHSDLGALPETAANWTYMYQYNENPGQHAQTFYNVLDIVVRMVKEKNSAHETKLLGQKSYVDLYYNWDVMKMKWAAFLESIKNEPTSLPKDMFVYSS